jgi:F-type H+-transporting ATPase subunit gamma
VKRAEDIRGRIDNIRQIEAVISALRALAVAHRREAERHLAAIRAHAETIGAALADILGGDFAPQDAAATPARGLLIVVGAAQGFGGAYGDRIAEAALAAPETDDLMVIGHRTAETLEARGASALWSADMAAHAADVPALASRLADAAFERVAAPGHDRLAILHAAPPAPGEAPAPPARRSLVPLDFGRFPPSDPPPLTTLPRAGSIRPIRSARSPTACMSRVGRIPPSPACSKPSRRAGPTRWTISSRPISSTTTRSRPRTGPRRPS